MGEARRRRKKHAQIIERASGCVYCAAQGVAEQIDHMPPRSMFRTLQRPRGLEFPSCGACNQGTSRLDVVATFMTRTFPGISSEQDSREWNKVMHEISRVAPELAKEIFLPEHQMNAFLRHHGTRDPNHAAFFAAGPILSSHMQAFAAKVGFALHYERTRTVVPELGRVQVRWFTSEEILNQRIPHSVKESILSIRNLQQGKISSNGFFEYGWGQFSEKPDVNMYYAKFREAFMVVAFVSDTENGLPFRPGELATFAPGDLSMPLFDRIVDEWNEGL